jgi:hypothetical protein
LKGVNKCLLDDCGINDFQFSVILNAIAQEREFKKLVYKANEFGKYSLGFLTKILKKKIPNNLEELRLENIQISKDILKDLL